MAEATTEDVTRADGGAEMVTLVVSRAEAEFIAEGMKMLANCNRFRFKDPDVDVHDLYGGVLDAADSVQDQVKRVLSAKS